MKQILALSDIHGNISNLKKILNQEENVDTVLLCGDITGYGDPAEAETVLDILFQYSNFLTIRGIPGNMDSPAVLALLEKKKISVHGCGEIIETIGIFGVGGSNPTPMATPFEISEEEIMELLEAGYKMVQTAGKKILLAHPPPYATTLDRIMFGRHVGSRSVSAFLEKSSCDLCLCGHIHESSGEEKIHTTHTVNTGAVLHGAYGLIEYDNDNNTFKVTRRHV